MPILGFAVTSAARHAAHLATLIVNFVIIGALCIYTTYKAKDRELMYNKKGWQKWGPSVLCWIGLPLICADPFRHVLSDKNVWQSCQRSCGQLWNSKCNWSSNEYKCQLICYPKFQNGTENTNCSSVGTGNVHCTCVHDSQENMSHLSIIGVIFTIIFTYLGFGLFIYGSLWNANIVQKLKEVKQKWRQIRNQELNDQNN